ncbi:hypothetical protein VOLCADRAFT_118886, partial [Volvox carteri f. nagariensis]
AKPRSRPSDPGPEAPPVAVRKKGLSDPPLPGGPEREGQQGEQSELDAGPVKDQANKRSVPAAQPAAGERRDERDRKRQKKVKNSEHQEHQPRSGRTAEADASGGVKDSRHTADGLAAAAAHGVDVDAEAGARPGASKRNARNKAVGTAAQGAPNGVESAANLATSSQPAATNDNSKKPRTEKGRSAATNDQAGPSNATGDPEPKAGKPRAASQQVEPANTQQAAGKAAFAAPAAAGPSAYTIQPPKTGAAAAAALSLARLNAGEEREPAGEKFAPTTSAAEPQGPFTSGCVLQLNTRSAAGPGPVNAAEGGWHLPATGTTPVKTFNPVSLPRLDDIGLIDRKAVAELQVCMRCAWVLVPGCLCDARQLSEVRFLYDELKATKIQGMEKMMAEQVAHAEEQRIAQHWEAVAKRAEEKANSAAGNQDTAQLRQLLKEKGHLLLRVAQLEIELSQVQQALHDARAQLVKYQTGLSAGPGRQAQDNNEANVDQGTECPQRHAGAEAEHGEGTDSDGARRDDVKVAQQEPLPDVTLAGGCSPGADDAAAAAGSIVRTACQSPSCGAGVQFPTPAGGTGAQFPSPSAQFFPMRGLGTVPGSGSRSVGRGVSTECQRIVQMLPSLRHSTGSPIDGICGADNLKAVVASAAADLSHAHNMGAPEAFQISGKQALAQEPKSVLQTAALVATAATKPLPPSPSALRQMQPVPPAGYPRGVSPDGAAAAAAAVIQCGSVTSKQDSCNLPGVAQGEMGQLQATQHAMGNQAIVQPPQDIGDKAQDGQGPRGMLPRSPSPRTAKIKFYEGMVGWHVDVISTKPMEAYRVTHTACGLSFELRETEVDPEDLEDVESTGQPLGDPVGDANKAKFYEYVPLNLGAIGEYLPAHLKVTAVSVFACATSPLSRHDASLVYFAVVHPRHLMRRAELSIAAKNMCLGCLCSNLLLLRVKAPIGNVMKRTYDFFWARSLGLTVLPFTSRMQETITISQDQRPKLLEKLDAVVKGARSRKP